MLAPGHDARTFVRLKPALPEPLQEQASTGVIPGLVGLDAEVILREEHILGAIAVQIGDSHTIRGGRLRPGRQRTPFQMIPAVEEHARIEVQRRHAGQGLPEASEQVVHRGPTERLGIGEATRRIRNQSGQGGAFADRPIPTVRSDIAFEHIPDSVALEISVADPQGPMTGIGTEEVIPPPVSGHEIHAPIAIEVSGVDPQPKPRPLGEAIHPDRQPRSPKRRIPGFQRACPIAEQPERPPGGADRQIRMPVVIQIGEDRALGQPQSLEGITDHQAPATVADQPGRRRLGIPSRHFADTDEDLQFAVAIDIGRSHGTHRTSAAREDLSAGPGRRIHDPDRSPVGEPVFQIADAGQDHPPLHEERGQIPGSRLEERRVDDGGEPAPGVVGEDSEGTPLPG